MYIGRVEHHFLYYKRYVEGVCRAVVPYGVVRKCKPYDVFPRSDCFVYKKTVVYALHILPAQGFGNEKVVSRCKEPVGIAVRVKRC